MRTFVVPANIGPRQVDFPEGCERSKKGSLHVRPASMLELTDSEWKYLQDKHADLAKHFIRVGQKPGLKSRVDPEKPKKTEAQEKRTDVEKKPAPAAKSDVLTQASKESISRERTSDKETTSSTTPTLKKGLAEIEKAENKAKKK